MIPTLWPTSDLRRASINSFGIGGSNCHVVLDDAYHYMHLRGLTGRHNTTRHCSNQINGNSKGQKNGDAKAQDSFPLLLVWSSADENGINRWGELYKDFFSECTAQRSSWDQSYYRNLAFTLACRRSMLLWKSYAIISPTSRLQPSDTIMSKPRLTPSISPKLGFVFTGQGAQWPRMALELMGYPVFRKSLQDAENYLGSLQCCWSIKGNCFPSSILCLGHLTRSRRAFQNRRLFKYSFAGIQPTNMHCNPSCNC